MDGRRGLDTFLEYDMNKDSTLESLQRRRLLQGALASAGALTLGAFQNTIAYADASSSSIAKTRTGQLAGMRIEGVHVFKGVPYGADTRAFRFRAAGAPAAWKGTREALEYGPACPQRNIDEATSEDCLSLNVWTPALRDSGKRPVLVYFHGGEFSSGSGSSPLYDGTRLSRRGDVVVITVNHRLNIFGHMYLERIGGGAYASSGNVGILDLVQALTWVRDHAEEFGGDPKRVTVFGQSGGGAKIATLMAMPAARGLFQRAWTMSGQQVTASGPRSATLRARACLDQMKIKRNELESLLKASTSTLVEAARAADPTMVGRNVYFGPVLDQDALPRHPFYPDAPPQSADIPMVLGNTLDETRAFHGNDPGIHELTWDELPERLLPALHVDIEPEYVIAEYRKLFPKLTASEVFFAATTAGRSWRGQVIEADLRAAQGTNSYVYQLNYRSPLEGGRYGAMHGMDIPMVFDNIAQPGSRSGTSAAAQRTADAMSEALLAFARTGNPNHAKLEEWRPYTLPDRPTMVFNAESRLENDPRGPERRLFEAVPYIQRGTY
jgi:para-nitrobenzyl esterase